VIAKWIPDEHPLSLAIFRVTVIVVVLLNPAVREAVQLASIPEGMRVLPPGMFRLLQLPITPLVARGMQIALVGGCFAGLVGWHTRVALTIAALSAFYVLGLPQIHGNVIHHHHLAWFLALLAASPCGDALSLDRDERPSRSHPLAYAIPLSAARLLIAMIFFFPGTWKLRDAGIAWIASDNLRHQMWWKWFQFDGYRPFVRIDRFPLLCRVLAGCAVVFELAMPILVLVRRTRIVSLVVALAFHAFTAIFLKIDFPSLWLCYVVLVDWYAVARFFQRRGLVPAWLAPQLALDPEESTNGSMFVPASVALLTLAGCAVTGVVGLSRAWPFACYPTFQNVVGSEMPGLSIVAVMSDGRTIELNEGPRSQAAWGIEWSLVGLMGDPSVEARLRAHWATRPRDARSSKAIAIRFDRVWWSVVPDDWGKPPVRRQTILTLAP